MDTDDNTPPRRLRPATRTAVLAIAAVAVGITAFAFTRGETPPQPIGSDAVVIEAPGPPLPDSPTRFLPTSQNDAKFKAQPTDIPEDPEDVAYRNAYPAAAHLPFAGGVIRADLVALTPEGHPSIRVAYYGTLQEGKAGWRRYLDLYIDRGEHYQVRFVAWNDFVDEICPPATTDDCQFEKDID